MPYRSPRGIQYEDVAHAADALLQEGARPTIERIRLRLGRGSPNTVSPMLEQWFAGLGQRLGGAGTAPPGSSAADAAVAQTWSTRQAAQDATAQTLENARAQLQARELALDERLQAMETALTLSTQQLRESNERAKVQQTALEQREEELRDARAALAAAAQRSSAQLTALQQQLEQTQAQARDERSAIEARHVANERRWLEEVDRARQEARKSAVLAQEEAKKNALLHTQAALAADTAAHALQSLREECASAQSQAVQAQTLLAQLQEKQKEQEKTALAPSARQALNPTPPLWLPLRSQFAPRLPLRRKLGKNSGRS